MTQDKFIKYLAYIQLQLVLCDDEPDKHTLAIIRLFKKTFANYKEIENWIVFENYGKLTETTPEELFYKLTKKNKL